jgi:hypothetical protein
MEIKWKKPKWIKPNVLKQFHKTFVSFSKKWKESKFVYSQIIPFSPGLCTAKLISQKNDWTGRVAQAVRVHV